MTATKEETFWDRLKSYLKQYNEKSSIHGLHYLSENRSMVEKLFWALILLCSLSVCLMTISEILVKFEKSPMVVTFSKKYTPIYEIPFPSFTVCPESKCDRSVLDYTSIFMRLMLNQNVSETTLRDMLYMTRLCRETNEDVLNRGNDTFEEIFYDIIDKVKPAALLSCTFLYNKEVECEDLLTPIITDVGICYSFNLLDRRDLFRDHVVHYKNFHSVANYSAKNFDKELFTYNKEADIVTYPRRALFSGIDNSFDLVFMSIASGTDYLCNTYYDGFRILLHSPLDIPRLSKSYFRIPLDRTVAAAVHPKLLFTSESVKHLPPEKRQCYWREERYLKHFKVYTQSNCFLECLTNYTLEKCGCVDFYMPREEHTPICGTKKTKCLKEADNELQLEDLKTKLSGKDTEGHTYCDCRASCTELTYETEVSHSQLSWRKLIDALGFGIIKGDELDGNFSFLSIYVKEEQIMGIEQNELYGIFDLIANFGGLLGLFTGFSLISFCEIIYCLTLKIFYNKKLYGSWSGPKKLN